MKVLIFGATGKTGGLVVDRARAKGHEVTVLVRDPNRFQRLGVRILAGDSTSPPDVLHAMQGQDAVIESIGGTTPYKTTRLESTSARNIIDAMQQSGAQRLIVVSMMGLGDSVEQAPFWYRYLLMTTFLRGSTADKRLKEEEVVKSRLNYIIVRPPILADGPATGNVKVLSPGMVGHKITRADLANFLVDQLADDTHLNTAVTIVNS